MNWIMDNWMTISYAIGIVISVLIVIFVPKHWLLGAVTWAESKIKGEKVGLERKMKVYNLFLQAFPILSKFLPYALFSILVDSALKQMRIILEKSPGLKNKVENGTFEICDL